MNKIIAENPQNLAKLASEWCQEKVSTYKAKRMFLPSGGTPQSLYKLWENERPEFLEGIELTQLDEVISGSHAGSFQNFFKTHLPSYFPQFVELEKQESQPDLVVLGLGVNGHVAFHEPSLPKSFFKAVVPLSESTCRLMGDPPGVMGLTFGVDCFLNAKAILLMIAGPNKERVTKEFFENPQADFPAALLRNHPDLTVLVSN